jgi:asparagine N-glycosylation enzyme membrane subunit Stt3
MAWRPAIRRRATQEAALADSDDDGLTVENLERALRQAPRGAFAVAGVAVGLLMAAWLAIYLFVFLPRGSVG